MKRRRMSPVLRVERAGERANTVNQWVVGPGPAGPGSAGDQEVRMWAQRGFAEARMEC